MPLIRKTSDRPPEAPGPQTRALDLGADSAEERWAAARAAADQPGSAGALGLALRSERDAQVREAIFTSLVSIGSAESVDVVIPLLRSDDANLRTGALDALRSMPQAIRSRLRDLLNDPDTDVRLLVCDLVRIMPDAEGNLLLCELLEQERVANVCSAAIDVLAETGNAACLPSLERCAARFPHDPFISFAVKVTSERISASPAARPPLKRPS